jgi:hypothetical protein
MGLIRRPLTGAWPSPVPSPPSASPGAGVAARTRRPSPRRRRTVVEFTVEEDGSHPFVSHDFHDAAKGALGLFTTNGEVT